MATELTTSPVNESYSDVFREVTTSAKQLIQSELELVKVELKDLTAQITSNLTQVVLFGALVIVSAVPLLASAVIALGDYWDGNYALSALIVGLACLAVGGIFGYRAITKLLNLDMSLPAATDSLQEGVETVQRKSSQLTTAVAGV
jgi:uncharacterized membrane protein YqjE